MKLRFQPGRVSHASGMRTVFTRRLWLSGGPLRLDGAESDAAHYVKSGGLRAYYI